MREPSPTVEALKAFFPARARQWLGPLSAAGLLAAIGGAVVVATGLLAFPASREDPEGLARIVHTAFKNSTREHSRDVAVPADHDAPWRVQLGAGHYARVCASCHGEPGRGQSPIATSMRPRPQYLAHVVGEFEERELFWIVQNGVKFAGMPAWPHPQREDEIWSLVAFLKQIRTMAPQDYARQAYGEAAGADAAARSVPASAGHPYTVRDADEPPVEQFNYTWPAVGFRTPTYDLGGAKGCEGCHGANGNGRPGGMAPNLTLQSPEYLQKALQAYATGTRPSGIMQSVAAALSDDDMARLAQRYGDRMLRTAGGAPADGPAGAPATAQDAAQASAPTSAPPAAPASAPAAAGTALGASIATQGLAARDVPACINCHGAAGAYQAAAKLPGFYPRLDGQNREYLAQQLRLFRADRRGGREASDPMSAIAHNLSDDEIAALTAYYAARMPDLVAASRAASGAAR